MKLLYSLLALSSFIFLVNPVFGSEKVDDEIDPNLNQGLGVFVTASNINGDVIADVSVPFVEGHDGFDYMLQGRDLKLFEMSHSFLGPFPVVALINGVRHDMRETGWCLSYETREGKLYKNVGLKELKPKRGDKLIFKLLKMGTFPDRDELHPKSPSISEEENGSEDLDEL